MDMRDFMFWVKQAERFTLQKRVEMSVAFRGGEAVSKAAQRVREIDEGTTPAERQASNWERLGSGG